MKKCSRKCVESIRVNWTICARCYGCGAIRECQVGAVTRSLCDN